MDVKGTPLKKGDHVWVVTQQATGKVYLTKREVVDVTPNDDVIVSVGSNQFKRLVRKTSSQVIKDV